MRSALTNFFQGLAFWIICLMLVKLGVQGVYHAPVIQSALTRSPAIEMRDAADVEDSTYLTELETAKKDAAVFVPAADDAAAEISSPVVVDDAASEIMQVLHEDLDANQLPFLSLTMQAVFEKAEKQTADLGEVFENPFTIQLVTYVSHERATAEVERLKGMGLNAFIISSGTYHQVCINRFFEKDQAMAALQELKQHKPFDVYHDAFVRPVLR